MTEKQLQELESDSSVHGIGKEKSKFVLKKSSSDKEEKPPPNKTFNCRNCGTRHGERECPAYLKTCHNCQRQNHFQKMCRSRKKVHGLEEETKELHSNTNLFVGAVTTKVEVKLDTGSQVNILPVRELKKIIGSNPCMDPCTHKLVSYSDNKLTVLGTAKLPVEYKANVEKELMFHIVDTNQPGLLGLRSSQDLGLIKVVMMTNTEEEQSKLDADVKSDKSPQQLKEEVMQKYASVFTGLGRLEKPYHIEVDPTVTAVVNPPRTIPAALKDRVKTELEDMQKRGVFFRRVEEPTDWVSSMAFVEKPDGSLRICLDPRHLNKAIKREHFQLPTIEDIMAPPLRILWQMQNGLPN
ncbi:uncharacterized protein [Montipora foliosa]|uniref:uncharacterized protein n=1 Tax=Montipora foliosa TaxID=591990 RepID=UPI0035F20B0A